MLLKTELATEHMHLHEMMRKSHLCEVGEGTKLAQKH